jgi:hypothetical protein
MGKKLLRELIMEDKELKKKLAKIPDVDENGDPIYKIDDAENKSNKEKAESKTQVNKDGKR